VEVVYGTVVSVFGTVVVLYGTVVDATVVDGYAVWFA